MPVRPARVLNQGIHRNKSSRRATGRMIAAVEGLEQRRLLSGGSNLGFFNAPVTYSNGGVATKSVTAADVNGDGNIDLITANYNGTISVFLGNANGTFRAPKMISDGLGNGQAFIGSADFVGSNGSSQDKLDLVVFNHSNAASLLVSNGDGTFAAPDIMTFGSDVYSAAVGDFNGDGNPGLALGMSAGYVRIFNNNGGGNFTAGQLINIGSNAIDSVAAADLQNDGKLDLITSYDGGNVDVFLGNGDGTFVISPIIAASGAAGGQGFGVGDVNKDGKADLIVGQNSGAVAVLLGNGDGTFSQQQQTLNYGAGLSGGTIVNALGDGDADLVLTNATTGQLSFLIGSGGFFSNVAAYSVPSPAGVIAVDLNGDGKPDLVTVNGAAGSISVLLNNEPTLSSNLFRPETTIASANQPRDAVVADLNGDGIPDLVVAEGNLNAVQVSLGNGDGTFGAPRTYYGFNNPRSVAVADFNNTGEIDILVANQGDTGTFLLGNGSGRFTDGQTIPLGPPQSPGNYSGNIQLDVTDLNGDGFPDIVSSDYKNNTVSVVINNGSRQFSSPHVYNVGRGPTALAVGVLTTQGNPDIAVTCEYSGQVDILMSNGPGVFFPTPQALSVGGDPNGITIADVDGDGNPDIITANNPGNPYSPDGTASLSILSGDGGGSFNLSSVTPLSGNRAGTVIASDLFGTGKQDLIVATGYQTAGVDFLNVLFNAGTGGFVDEGRYSVDSSPDSVQFADINGDGKPDLIVANKDHNKVSVLINTSFGSGFFQIAKTINLGSVGPESIAVGDLNGDGKQDLVIADRSTNAVQILFGNGNGTFKAPVVLQEANGAGPTDVLLTALTTGGPLDIVTANSGNNTISVFINNGSGVFNPTPESTAVPKGISPGPDAIAAGDFDGDGKTDLAVANNFNGTVNIFPGFGDGTFAPYGTISIGSNMPRAFAVATGDFNKDGNLDLAVTDANNNQLLLFQGNGDGNFKNATSYATGSYPTSIAVGDLNGDGNPDIVVTNKYNSSVGVFLNKGNGSFSYKGAVTTGPYPFQAAIADVNGDGNADIVVVEPGNSSSRQYVVTSLPGNGDGTFKTPVISLVGNYPRSLAVGDFNGDGKPDVAVANAGGNSASILLNSAAPVIKMSSGGMVSVTATTGSNNLAVTAANGSITFNIGGQIQTFVMSLINAINIKLGSGADSVMISAGVPAVSVNGGGGSDTIMGMNNAADSLNGGAGNDMIVGTSKNNMLMGGAGTDMIEADSKHDTVIGGGGNDTVDGSGGHNMLRGGPGSNLFFDAGSKKDTIQGGLGLNFAQFNPSDSTTQIFEVFDPPAPLSATPAAAADAGASPADSTAASASVNGGVLDVAGTTGSDTISAALDSTMTLVNVTDNGNSLGSFSLAGLTGISIAGGKGADSISVGATITLQATLSGGGGADTLVGGGGNNVLIGGNGSDSLVGGAGTNLLVGQTMNFNGAPKGNDTLDGGTGSSIADFTHRTDPLHLSNDGLPDSGGAGEKTQINANIQAIWGGTGSDTIIGTHGGVFLSGGAGANSITGGGASDLLAGGAGSDSVVVAAEPVVLYLRNGQADEYTGVSNPAEDILQLDAGLDSLVSSL